MLNSKVKNICIALKCFALSLIDLYFFAYIALICTLIYAGKDYAAIMVVVTVFAALNCACKYKLNKYYLYRNIGIKYGTCTIVLCATYLILCLIGKFNLNDALIFILSVLSLFGISDTNINLFKLLHIYSADKQDIEAIRIITEKDLLKNTSRTLSELCTADNKWAAGECEKDSVATMLSEFAQISNENQLGHIVIRSMTRKDDCDTINLCIKAKAGYQLIMRGAFEDIIGRCSDLIIDNKLEKLEDENKENLIKQINSKISEGYEVVCCAFKETADTSSDDENNYIFAGYAVYSLNANINYSEPVIIAECSNIERTKKIVDNEFECSSDVVSVVTKRLHMDNKFVCGRYSECDGDFKPVSKNKIKIKINNDFEKHIANGYLILVAVLLISANIFAALFDTPVFNACEIITFSVFCFLYLSVASFCGKLKNSKRYLYLSVLINVLTVVISYFLGRYIMLNGGYENDLFYTVTARTMTSVTLLLNTLFAIDVSTRYTNVKARLVCYSALVITLLCMLLPAFARIFEGYRISFIYLLNAALISFGYWIILNLVKAIKFK